MNGILNVYKETGMTSHDVIYRLRKICGQKKIGHTGTLDPNAEGVLPVCFGNATKVCGLLTDTDKSYRAELILGKRTDTYDITGTVLQEQATGVSKQELEQVIRQFTGRHLQVPPMYSARRVNGQRLYDLARQGITVERQAKEVEISRISIEALSLENSENQTAFLQVDCSKGTYIRSLCYDIGEALGCGACMGSLIRTRVGRFELAESKTLTQIQELSEVGTLISHMVPADEMFDYQRLTVSGETLKHLLANGNQLPLKELSAAGWMDGTEKLLRVYEENGRFAAIYQYRPNRKELSPVTMFPE